MKQYYLQHGVTETSQREYKRGDKMTPPEPREFLDAHVHGTNRVVATVVADDWCQAKAELFPW
jgi:hypothetical protein